MASTVEQPGTRQVPLCVDLDGTLIRTDILWESMLHLWRRPLQALCAFWALMVRGKAGFKAAVAQAVPIDPATLPYHQGVLAYARAQRAAGRDVVLATASHRMVAERIAEHLGLFSRVLATEGTVNLSDAQKRAALEACFGKRGFDYIGDSPKDLIVFRAAREALLVDPSASLLAGAAAAGNVAHVFSDDRPRVKMVARALRLHQWAKNVLLAIPLLAAHLVLDGSAWLAAAIAFLAFGCVASATYLFNDLLDLQSDRLHPTKRFRPLASGELTIRAGIALAAVLGVLGFALSAALLPAAFVAYLVVYVLITLGYSLYLKRRLLADVLTLALLYTLRILAGGAAVGVVVSEWLLMFSLFIFFSLAFVKRVDELQAAEGPARLPGRGYSALDAEVIRIIGVCSGLMSVLVLSLYITSSAVTQLYRLPEVLWLICPLLTYWVARVWVLAARGEIRHDPVVFVLLDWRSYMVGAAGAVIVLFAKFASPELRW